MADTDPQRAADRRQRRKGEDPILDCLALVENIPKSVLRIEPGAQADLVLVNPEAMRAYDTDANRRMVYRDICEHEQLVNRSDGVVADAWIAGRK